MKKLENCVHCKGKGQCTRSGGRSCDPCLAAAGRPTRQWATVRCAQCGGRGKVLVDVVEEKPAEEQPAEKAEKKASKKKAEE